MQQKCSEAHNQSIGCMQSASGRERSKSDTADESMEGATPTIPKCSNHQRALSSSPNHRHNAEQLEARRKDVIFVKVFSDK